MKQLLKSQQPSTINLNANRQQFQMSTVNNFKCQPSTISNANRQQFQISLNVCTYAGICQALADSSAKSAAMVALQANVYVLFCHNPKRNKNASGQKVL